MNRFAYFFAGLVATFSMIWTTSAAMAQGTTIVPEEETAVVLEPEGFHIFHINVTNNGFGPLTFYVLRTVNQLPDDGWASAICMDSFCYDDPVNQTDPVVVDPGMTYSVKLNVFAGKVDNTEGRFTLKFMASGSSGGDELEEIEFSVQAKSSAGVPRILDPAHLPFPNPALSDITIPLAAVSNPQRAEVCNITGSQVALFDAKEIATNPELRLNVEDFVPGLYYYKITGRDEVRSGSFTVVK